MSALGGRRPLRGGRDPLTIANTILQVTRVPNRTYQYLLFLNSFFMDLLMLAKDIFTLVHVSKLLMVVDMIHLTGLNANLMFLAHFNYLRRNRAAPLGE